MIMSSTLKLASITLAAPVLYIVTIPPMDICNLNPLLHILLDETAVTQRYCSFLLSACAKHVEEHELSSRRRCERLLMHCAKAFINVHGFGLSDAQRKRLLSELTTLVLDCDIAAPEESLEGLPVVSC